MVKKQRHNITVAQVSVDTQQGSVAEDITTVIHIGPAHNQQPADLDRRGAKSQSVCVRVCMCEYVRYDTLMLGVYRLRREERAGLSLSVL